MRGDRRHYHVFIVGLVVAWAISASGAIRVHTKPCAEEIAMVPAFVARSSSVDTAWHAWQALDALVEGLDDEPTWSVEAATAYVALAAELRRRHRLEKTDLPGTLFADLLARERVLEQRRAEDRKIKVVRDTTAQEQVGLWLRLEIFRQLRFPDRLPTQVRAQHSALLVRQTGELLDMRLVPYRALRRDVAGKSRNFFRVVPYDELASADREVLDRLETGLPMGKQLAKLAAKLKNTRGVALEIDPGTSGLRGWIHRDGQQFIAALYPDELLTTALKPQVEATLFEQLRSVMTVERTQSLFAVGVHWPGTEIFNAVGMPLQFELLRNESLKAAEGDRAAMNAWLSRAKAASEGMTAVEANLGKVERYLGALLAERSVLGVVNGVPEHVGFAGQLRRFGEPPFMVVVPELGERPLVTVYRDRHAILTFPVTRAIQGTVDAVRRDFPKSVPSADLLGEYFVDLVLEGKRMVEAAAYDVADLKRSMTMVARLKEDVLSGKDVAPALRAIVDGVDPRREEYLTRRVTADPRRLWQARAPVPAAASPTGPVAVHTFRFATSPALFERLRLVQTVADRRALVEKIGMRAVIGLLSRNGLDWMDVSYDNLGFDIAARDRNGRTFQIEVKATAEANDRNRITFSLDEIVSLMAAGSEAVVARPVLTPDGFVEVVVVGHGLNWTAPVP